MSLKEVVNVVITRDTKPIAQAGFGIMLFMSKHTRKLGRVTPYFNADDVAADFGAESNEYLAALTAFSQDPCPVEFDIGKALLSTAEIRVSVPASTNGVTYSFKVYDAAAAVPTTPFTISYTCPTDGITQDTILDALLADFTSKVHSVTGLVGAVDAGTATTLIINGLGGTQGRDFAVAGETSNITLSAAAFPSSSEGTNVYSKSFAAVASIYNDWYAMAINSRTQSDILSAAAWAELNQKLFFCADADANAGVLGETTSTVTALGALSYARTVYMYKADCLASGGSGVPATFPEIAWFANLSTRIPGSYTGAFKTLVGIVTDDLEEGFSKIVRGKFGNTYELMAAAKITRDGWVVAGEFLDVIIFCDWLRVRQTEALFAHITRAPKVPFTDGGIQALGGDIKSVLDLGVKNGGIADDTPYTLTLPKSKDVPVNDRAARKLTGVTWTARLAGAIQAIDVNGTVTV